MVVTYALAAALCFALASVLQQHEAVAAPAEQSMRIGLLTHLMRRPRWLAGIVIDAGGYLLQILALQRGSLSLVQPVLACGLLFALIFNRSPGQTGLRKRDWAAAAVTAGGLLVFVVAGAPVGTASAEVSGASWLMFGALTGLGLLGCLLLGHHQPSWKAATFALGAGIAFGLSSALTKQSIFEFHDGFWQMLGTGYPYALAGFGAAGMILSQSAFQAGSLAASLPTLTLSEPVYAAMAGAVLFGEHLRGGWFTVVALVGASVAAVGVVRLARSPRAQPVLSP